MSSRLQSNDGLDARRRTQAAHEATGVADALYVQQDRAGAVVGHQVSPRREIQAGGQKRSHAGVLVDEAESQILLSRHHLGHELEGMIAEARRATLSGAPAHVVDRVDRRLLMVSANLARVGLYSIIAVWAIRGSISIWWLIALLVFAQQLLFGRISWRVLSRLQQAVDKLRISVDEMLTGADDDDIGVLHTLRMSASLAARCFSSSAM